MSSSRLLSEDELFDQDYPVPIEQHSETDYTSSDEDCEITSCGSTGTLATASLPPSCKPRGRVSTDTCNKPGDQLSARDRSGTGAKPVVRTEQASAGGARPASAP